MKAVEYILILLLFILSGLPTYAQGDAIHSSHSIGINWESLLLVDIEANGGNPDLTMTTNYSHGTLHIDAGQGMGVGTILASNDNTWINWTVFAPEDASQKFKIDVQSDYAFDEGWDIKLTPLINGTVQQGTAVAQSPFYLSNANQTVVSDISYLGWSGDGVNFGCNIKYEVVVSEPETIVAPDKSVSVMFTISSQ